MNASPTLEEEKRTATTTTPKRRLKKKSEIPSLSPSVETPAKEAAAAARAKKGKAKAVAPPEAKAPEQKKKGKAAAKAEAAAAPAKGAAGAPKKILLPPPLGSSSEVAGSVGKGLPGWNSDGDLLWKAYGDLSLMPKVSSIVAVSLNNGPIQVGDNWRREQGFAFKEAEDWMWWNAACVPALRAISLGSAGASAFSPDGGQGLAAALPKTPVNLVATALGGPDKAVAAAEAAAEAAIARVPPAPARPLFLLRSDGVIKGAVNGKAAQKLERVFDCAASRILDDDKEGEGEEAGSASAASSQQPPFVVVIIRSKNKEGMLEQISEFVAPKLGLPAPDPERSTFVAGAVGKNWFEGKGGGGGGGGGGSSSSSAAAPPSDVDEQFSMNSGFLNVMHVPTAFGPTELKHSVSGRHGYLAGAVEHVSKAEKAAAAAAAARGAAAPASAAAPATGAELVQRCLDVLDREVPELKHNRELIAVFQALAHLYTEILSDRFKGRTFSHVAKSLAERQDLGDITSAAGFAKLCKGPQKLPGFAAGTARRAFEFFENGLPAELESYKA